ncbi:MAG: YpdA family putative bacillithiol disulfide reductase [Acidobacteriia bacterium]|jgi:thioredoxin reductase (NADPH)|nr:YpdA family putative bacillithiol disulfide reductase [Terriglobia bacterium]
MFYDLLCIGAGPTGLATAIEARRRGLRTLVVDKGCLCNSIYHYPTNMIFFTTPELLEIGGLPMVCAGEKPTRTEALKYYRKCAEHEQLELRLYERVVAVEPHNGAFSVRTESASGLAEEYRAKRIVVATGYYDLPNRLNVPGEDLPHVSHYYREAHPCWNRDVVVIGGKNSAVEAALDLFRGGARVTLIHRRAQLGSSVKYWLRPDIENRIKAGEVQARFETVVTRIEPGTVWVRPVDSSAEERPVRADFVFALTGYHPDFEFLRALGIALEPDTNRPAHNPETLESNVPGIYLAGVVLGGNQTGEIFIENGRFHGQQIVRAIAGN